MVTYKLQAAGAMLLALGSAVAAAEPSPNQPAKPSGQPAAWADLASTDEAKMVRAILNLAATPQETVAFLKDNLPPVKAEPQRVAKLIADLDSNEFDKRQKAVEDLEYLGKYIKADLEKALAGKTSPLEVRQRLQQLLDRIPKPAEVARNPVPQPGQAGNAVQVQVQVVNGQVIRKIMINGVAVEDPPPPSGPVGPSLTWLRAVRGIALLEHIATPEARELLEKLALGEADALPTEQAKAALQRLRK